MILAFLDIGSREARERDCFFGARRTSNRGTRKREKVASQEKARRIGKRNREASETETHEESLLQTATIQVRARRTRKRERQ
jgi:hypothetical protein